MRRRHYASEEKTASFFTLHINYTLLYYYYYYYYSTPKRDEVTGEWRRLHNKELYALYSSTNIFG
jgi:hypothetical protein